MAKYFVTYDLNSAGQNYDKIETAIRAYGSYCKLATTTWVVVSNTTAVAVRDNLAKALDSNDSLFVGTFISPSAWQGLDDAVSKWLQEN